MYNILKPITDLFKGFPFWFGRAKVEDNWKYLTDNDQWFLKVDEETKDIMFWYKGQGTRVKDGTVWHNLN